MCKVIMEDQYVLNGYCAKPPKGYVEKWVDIHGFAYPYRRCLISKGDNICALHAKNDGFKDSYLSLIFKCLICGKFKKYGHHENDKPMFCYDCWPHEERYEWIDNEHQQAKYMQSALKFCCFCGRYIIKNKVGDYVYYFDTKTRETLFHLICRSNRNCREIKHWFWVNGMARRGYRKMYSPHEYKDSWPLVVMTNYLKEIKKWTRLKEQQAA